MGFSKAVMQCYANMLNFSGRARRSEYWWFVLWTILASLGVAFGLAYYVSSSTQIIADLQSAGAGAPNPAAVEQMRYYTGYYFAFNALFIWLPQTAVSIRRLHDSDRSGAWWLIQFVPILGFIWFMVLMCLPGTHGTNRFGSDSAPDRKPPTPSHPAFSGELRGAERDRAEVARRAVAQDYYKRHVLPSIQKA